MKNTRRIRERIVSVRMSDDEHKVLQELADYKGVDMSDILRLPVINELMRRKDSERVA